MDSVINKYKAKEIVKKYAQLMINYSDLGIISIYSIGSLAGDNYKPGKSDLDVSIIINDENQKEKIEKISQQIISMLIRQYKINVDFDGFVKSKDMLYPPYLPEQQKTVEIMRIKNQAILLEGSFNKEDIPIPEKKDFLNDAQFFEESILKKFGQDYLDKMNQRQVKEFFLYYMRLCLYLKNNEFEFNKDKILTKFLKNKFINMTEEEKEILNKLCSGNLEKINIYIIKNINKKIKTKIANFNNEEKNIKEWNGDVR